MTIPASLFLILQAGLASAIDADPVKGWWPTQQYSWTDVLLVGITALYLIVTAVYAAISYGQWGVLRQTLEETKRSNSLALRAWLLAEAIKFDVSPENKISVTVTIRNLGKLPATNVTRKYEFLDPEDVAGPFPRPLPQPTRPLPGGRVIGAGQSHDYKLEREEARLALWLVARFSYTDALDSEGEFSYCWRYYPGIVTGDPYGGGNTASEFREFPSPGFTVS